MAHWYFGVMPRSRVDHTAGIAKPASVGGMGTMMQCPPVHSMMIVSLLDLNKIKRFEKMKLAFINIKDTIANIIRGFIFVLTK